MKISDYYTYAPKSKIKAGDANPNGKYQFYTSSPDESRRCDEYLYDCKAIVMGTGGSTTLHYYDGKFSTSTDCLTLIPNEKIRAKYLYYFFLANMDVLEAGFKGAGLKHMSKGYIDNIEITKIPSLPSQDKIVNLFDELALRIEKERRQIKKLDELVKARFVEMFNMESYPIKPLSEIAEYWNGLTYKPSDVSSDGTIVLRSSNIQDMQLDLNDIVRVKCKINNKKMVKTNDILMCSRNGSAKLVGKVALIPELEETMSFGAFMMIIRSAYYPYLMTYFQLPVFRSQISTGTTTINQITRYMLDKVSLPVPDMAKIKEFKTFVTQVDKSKFVLSNELTMCDFYIRLIHDRVMHSCINLRVAQ